MTYIVAGVGRQRQGPSLAIFQATGIEADGRPVLVLHDRDLLVYSFALLTNEMVLQTRVQSRRYRHGRGQKRSQRLTESKCTSLAEASLSEILSGKPMSGNLAKLQYCLIG
ncbi:hypothetical protein GGD67_002827 [Bradyrhizobium sp. IAR9]|uniref:hypothetical protein n=1 Tax=Bradyrhizobium sp. IAR9 TaxID=2663841 RepID=UPI0015C70FD6|nr:hypothetical protein [Bradyrhizobium sp. IAR9]NYG45369.1 hypothetical protein [Bradyrhizobium sp. IAR9]